MMGGGGAMNVNDRMIRGVLLNAAIIILFVMPMITMRTYSEEKRSGTIELLLTSPLTDVQIILGKFIGAMGLFAAMLLVTMIDVAILFRLGNPEWKPIATGYLGLLLMGGCFISVGLLISSLTKNQIVAGFMTFAVFLMLWVINWFGESVRTDREGRPVVSLDYRASRRLHARHHRHEAHRVLPEFHHVRPVPDGQVGRFGTLARLASKTRMLKRVLGLLGWLGVALVLAAVAISQLRPEWQWYRALAIGGLVCTLLYVLSQWREIAREFSGRQARFGTLATASVLVVLGILAAINYLAGRHNKRWDLTAGGQYTLSDQTKKVLQSLEQAGPGHGVRAVGGLRALPQPARPVSVPKPSSSRSNTSIPRSGRRSPNGSRRTRSARSSSNTTDACSA